MEKTVPSAPRPRRRIPWWEFLIAILLCAGTDLFLFHGRTALVFPDAMEYAQIARSLAEGNGYRTRTLWLSRLALDSANPDEWAERGAPDVRRPPLHVVITAAAFRLFGATDRVATAVSAVFATLTALLLFLGLRTLLGAPAAWLGLLLILLDPGRIFYGPTGLSEPLFAVLLLLFALTLIFADRARHSVLLAVLLGLMAWTRHNAFLLLPAAAAAMILDRRPVPWKHLGLFVAVFVPFLFLPVLRNGLVTGVWDPVGMPRWVAANEVGEAPAHLAERSLEPPPGLGGLVRNHPGALFLKVSNNTKRNADAAASAPSPFLWIVVALGIWLGWRDPRLRILLFFSGFSTVILILAFSLGEFEGRRFFSPFTPLWIAVGAFGLHRWLGERGPKLLGGPVPAWGTAILLAILIIYPGWVVARTQDRSGGLGPRFGFLRDAEYDGAAFLADVPWYVGWYGARTAYWLPFSPAAVEAAEIRVDVQYILLTPASGLYSELKEGWGPVLAGRPLPGYRVPALPGGDGFIVLFEREE